MTPTAGGRQRLTDTERRDRALSEGEFQRQVTDLATVLGWSWVHHRPAQTAHGWRTPVSGPLGKGWPDLTLLRVKDRRLIFAELKRETEHATAEQAAMLAALSELVPLIECYLWRPSDFDRIAETLR